MFRIVTWNELLVAELRMPRFVLAPSSSAEAPLELGSAIISAQPCSLSIAPTHNCENLCGSEGLESGVESFS
jgi:hypothetical protein